MYLVVDSVTSCSGRQEVTFVLLFSKIVASYTHQYSLWTALHSRL